MAEETLLPNGDNSGWPTGSYLDIDEGIASADANVLSTTTDNDLVIVDLGDSAVVDGDTVTNVTIKIHGRSTGSGGKDSFVVDWLIGGTPQGTAVTTTALTGSHATYTLNDIGWNGDWTASQMDGAQVRVKANQTGRGRAATWEVDAMDVVVTYVGSPTGRLMGGLTGRGGIAEPGGGLVG